MKDLLGIKKIISINFTYFNNFNIRDSYFRFVIMNEGYNYRMPENLQAVTNKETHKLLENNKGQQCLQNIAGCEFNTNSNKNVFLIGDSHAAALAFDLKDRIVEKNYKFTTYLIGEY